MSALFTRQMLVDARACEEQVAEFDRLFPEGSVAVTVARAKKLASVFDWDWARRFLDDPARAEYDRVTAPALAEYDRVRVAAWAEYKRVTAAALAEYDRVTVAARAEYKRVRAAAWAAGYIATCKRRAA